MQQGPLTRLIDPDVILRRQIVEFVSRGDCGLASGAKGDDQYERLWYAELIGAEEVEFEVSVFLLTKDKAKELKALPDCLPSRLLYCLGNPGVEAFALGLGGCGGSPVDLRRDPEGDLPGEWLIWSPASFFADLQVVVDREFELLPELSGGGALENDHVPSIHHFSMEDVGRVIESNRRPVSFVFHHRSIPASFRNRLTESTTPFRASFLGWGLWK